MSNSSGSLGIVNIKLKDQTLLCKWIWRFLEEDELCGARSSKKIRVFSFRLKAKVAYIFLLPHPLASYSLADGHHQS